MEISFHADIEQFIHRQIASGRYQDAGEVLGEAMRLLQAREQAWRWRAEDEDSLRCRLAAGLAEADRGELLDAEEVFAELERDAERDLNVRASPKE